MAIEIKNCITKKGHNIVSFFSLGVKARMQEHSIKPTIASELITNSLLLFEYLPVYHF